MRSMRSQALPRDGDLALRDRTLLMFLYNTGARVQEAADVRKVDIRQVALLSTMAGNRGVTQETLITISPTEKTAPVFLSQQRKPLTRFGIYKIVKRHTTTLKCSALRQSITDCSLTLSAIARPSTCSKRVSRSMSFGHGLATSVSTPLIVTLRSRCAQAGSGRRMPATRRSFGGIPLCRRMAKRPDLLKWLDSL